MSINSSSPYNSSHDSVLFDCFESTTNFLNNIALSVTRAFLLLPLSLLVLYLGHQRWQQQRSFKTTSHSDIFTYNVAIMELLQCSGCALIFPDIQGMTMVGYLLITVCYFGRNFFHILTCAERYLAVVHPVTYMGLRSVQGVRIRNISIGCVWLLSFALSISIILQDFAVDFTSLLILTLASLVVVSFCSLSVLCVLVRPGPGEGAGTRERVDKSKQRAFNTILAITAVLWLWFVWLLVSYAASTLLSPSAGCAMEASAYWFNLPVSLVSPLLYLHRAGKLHVLACCCCKSG